MGALKLTEEVKKTQTPDDEADAAFKEEAPTQSMLFSIVYYTICSSVMLVANKAAVHYVPLPGLLGCAQVLFTTVCVYLAQGMQWIVAHGFTLQQVKAFTPYALAFVASFYTNMKALQHSNVETVIVFRALSPLCVCFFDWKFLGRELPDKRSSLALLGILFGSLGYVCSDGQIQLTGIQSYGWSTAYLVTIVYSMTEGKQLLSKIRFQSPVWGSVLYTNVLCLPWLLLLALSTGEGSRLAEIRHLHLPGIWSVSVSCVVGVGISWSGWNCREKTSATTYTLVGVACKLLTVLLNQMIWDQHASVQGVCWLFVCIGMSGFYRQAPMKAKPSELMI